jgi:YHS domain-containing protein
MKKILILIMITVLAACDEAKQENTTETTGTNRMHDSTAAAPDFSMVQFASKRDTICRMPLTAGVSDTAIVDGKTYGFCSKECKEEFLKTLQVKK